jgi:hypothetical protein
MLHEILQAACARSAIGSRIDIWCRQIETHWIEVAITDSSQIPAALIQAINQGHRWDNLEPSPIHDPASRNLMICHLLAEQMGVDFNLFPLEDQRLMSRIVLPIANSHGRNE